MRWLRRGALMALLMTAWGTAARAEDDDRLVEFPADARTRPWTVVNDDVMGGRSRGSFRLTSRSLLFTGTTNTDGGGFASVRSSPGAFALADHDGIRLRVRGDGRTYTFRLTTREARQASRPYSYWARFPTMKGRSWEVVDIPFSSFRPRWRGQWLDGPALDPGAIDGLGLMIYDQKDGAFRLEVDWIGAYRSATKGTLDDLRVEKRTLIVFAPREDDPRFQRQLALVRQNREALESRDVVVIVVVDDEASRLGSGPLAAGAADRLRSHLGVAQDAFALRLLGTDGRVLRRSEDVAWTAGLVVLLDALPRASGATSRPSGPVTRTG